MAASISTSTAGDKAAEVDPVAESTEILAFVGGLVERGCAVLFGRSATIFGDLVVWFTSAVFVGGAPGRVCAEYAAHGAESDDNKGFDKHLRSRSAFGSVIHAFRHLLWVDLEKGAERWGNSRWFSCSSWLIALQVDAAVPHLAHT